MSGRPWHSPYLSEQDTCLHTVRLDSQTVFSERELCCGQFLWADLEGLLTRNELPLWPWGSALHGAGWGPTLALFLFDRQHSSHGHLSLSHLQARLEICTLRDTVAAHLTPESR